MSPELVLAGHQPDVDLVDEPMLALSLQFGLCLLGLIGPDEILLQRLVDDREARGDGCRVVGCAIFPQ